MFLEEIVLSWLLCVWSVFYFLRLSRSLFSQEWIHWSKHTSTKIGRYMYMVSYMPCDCRSWVTAEVMRRVWHIDVTVNQRKLKMDEDCHPFAKTLINLKHSTHYLYTDYLSVTLLLFLKAQTKAATFFKLKIDIDFGPCKNSSQSQMSVDILLLSKK